MILALFFVLNACFAQDDPAIVRARLGFEGRVVVKLQKNTFLFGEPIRVDLEYTNFSDPGPKLDYTELKQRLDLYDSSGKKVMGGLQPSAFPGRRALDVNETLSAWGELLEGFGTYRYYEGIEKAGYRMLPIGRYSAQCVVLGLESNIVEFEVVVPQGEDEAAFELFDDLSMHMAIMYSCNRYNTHEEQIIDKKNFEDSVFRLFQAYPYHIYTQRALVYPRVFACKECFANSNSIIGKCHEFYVRYPNSPFIDRLVQLERDHYSNFNGPMQAIEKMEKLAGSSYSEAVKKAARRIIEQNRRLGYQPKEK